MKCPPVGGWIVSRELEEQHAITWVPRRLPLLIDSVETVVLNWLVVMFGIRRVQVLLENLI